MPADSAALAALPWGSTANWEPSRATVKPLLSSVSALAAWMPVRVPSAPRSSASMFQPPTLYSPTSTPSSVVPSAAFTSKSTFPSAVSAHAEPATPVASVAAAAMAASSLFNRFAMVPSVLSSGLPMTEGDYAGKELLPNGRRTA